MSLVPLPGRSRKLRCSQQSRAFGFIIKCLPYPIVRPINSANGRSVAIISLKTAGVSCCAPSLRALVRVRFQLPLAAAVMNALDRPLKGTLRLTSPVPFLPAPAPAAVAVAAKSAQTLTLAPALAPGADFDLGLVELPAELTVGDRTYRAGPIVLEAAEQRAWLMAKGDYQEARGKSPLTGASNTLFDKAGRPTTAKAWQAVLSDATVPTGKTLTQAGDLAYAFTRILSPEKRDVNFRATVLGAEVRVWLNGEEAFRSVASDSENVADDIGLDILREQGVVLKKGWNDCVVEIHRTRHRYADPPLTVLDRQGKCLRDLVFDHAGK